MEDQAAHVVQLYHLVVAGLGLVGGFIAWDRHFNAPLRKWRADMDVWRAGVDKDLAHGNTRMDNLVKSVNTLTDNVNTLTLQVTRLNTLLEGAVLKGVTDGKD